MSTAPAGAPLVARTVPLADPGPLLALLPAEDALAWIRRGEGLVAWGCALRVHTTAADRFTAAEDAWARLTRHAVVRDEVGLPGTGPVAFGSFAFSPHSAAGGVLVVPEVVVGHRAGRWWVTTMGAGALVPGLRTPTPRRRPRPPGEVAYADGARSAPDWEGVVAAAITRIGLGEVEKVVLARDLEARAARPVDPRWLLERLTGRYPGCWTFSVDGLVGATPEMLVRREKGLVTSRVLAGTIRRTGDDAHDLALAARLARSSKDLEEHEYAVRSVAQALAPHCTSTNVPDAPFVLHLANVMHLATDVTGVLTDDSTSLTLAAALHPSAAVCGTPTTSAAALIEELEGMDRDRYAGPVGWMDAQGDGEWAIALRCARLDPADRRRARLFAGCGIVAGSDPEAELSESDAKLVPMRDALASD
ncbi:MAG TPA: isochorismate synthase [Kineosporiaceae bacterium]|nr:isochorismate synthase [Kineosporiaceae bacterium]